MMQSQETCPDGVAAFERPRKGVQAAVGNIFSEEIPSPACRFRAAEEVTGFCFFNSKIILSVISVALCVSVVNVFKRNFTTEAQRATEKPQR